MSKKTFNSYKFVYCSSLMKKKALVFQHINIENLGLLERLMKNENFEIDYIKLFDNQKIPKDLSIYTLMISLGGPMDTFMKNEYPWIDEEKESIKKFTVELEKPFIGLCLGAQLFGEVLGGKVSKSKKSEIGFLDVSLTKESKSDNVLEGFPKKFKVFQWHSYEVSNLNGPHIKILGSSDATKIQIFKYKNHSYGIQFHLELEENTISKWHSDEIYRKNLLNEFGSNSIERIINLQKNHLKSINYLCHLLFQNFINQIKN